MAKKRNGEIELLRMFFTIAVLLLHSNYVSNGEDMPYFYGGWLGVEFFFIVSGYLMAAYEDCLPPDKRKIGSQTWRFIAKKATRLYPYLIFATITQFIGWSIHTESGLFSVGKIKLAITALLNLIFPYSLGFKDFFYVGFSWYLSAMIYAMFILFPLLRINRNAFVGIIAPLVTVFGLGFYSFHYSNLGYVNQANFILSNGLIRGLAEISLGCICYSASKKMRNIMFTKMGGYILSFIEISCMFVVAARIIFLRNVGSVDFVVLALIAIVATISFSGKSKTAFEISGKLANFSGNFSLALYLNSNCWSYLTARLWPSMSYWNATFIYILMSVSAALLCMFVCWGIKKMWIINKNIIFEKIIVNNKNVKEEA